MLRHIDLWISNIKFKYNFISWIETDNKILYEFGLIDVDINMDTEKKIRLQIPNQYINLIFKPNNTLLVIQIPLSKYKDWNDYVIMLSFGYVYSNTEFKRNLAISENKYDNIIII